MNFVSEIFILGVSTPNRHKYLKSLISPTSTVFSYPVTKHLPGLSKNKIREHVLIIIKI